MQVEEIVVNAGGNVPKELLHVAVRSRAAAPGWVSRAPPIQAEEAAGRKSRGDRGWVGGGGGTRQQRALICRRFRTRRVLRNG